MFGKFSKENRRDNPQVTCAEKVSFWENNITCIKTRRDIDQLLGVDFIMKLNGKLALLQVKAWGTMLS